MTDLIDLERQGKDVESMRALFRQNRMISSITSELDQKSCWEVLTDAQFTRTYFSADERHVRRVRRPSAGSAGGAGAAPGERSAVVISLGVP